MTIQREDRPADIRTAWNASGEDTPIVPFNVPIRCRVFVDLSPVDDGDVFDRHAEAGMQDAVYSPKGAHVVFRVARRQLVPFYGVQFVRENGQHLGSITIECSDSDTADRWYRALNGTEAAL